MVVLEVGEWDKCGTGHVSGVDGVRSVEGGDEDGLVMEVERCWS